MKRNAKKFLSMFSAALLMVSTQSHIVSAKDFQGAEEPAVMEMSQAEDAQIGSTEKKAEPPQFNREDPAIHDAEEIGKNTAEPIQDAAMAVDDADADTPSMVYYGVLSGYLAQAKDAILYTVNLNAGEYFQAKLTPPADAAIDYELLLYDSSLNFIKACDYVTCTTSEMATLEESIGYLAGTTETVYVCAYSAAGGSDTQAYKLEYTITTHFKNAGEEPDDNAKEATALTLGSSVAKVTGKIHTPLDNDWYSFTVGDISGYDAVRLDITSSSKDNGCKVEIYQDLTAGYYAMLRVASGTSGEIELPAGAYYARVVSTNTFENFNNEEIPAYSFSVCQTTRVDGIELYEFDSYLCARNITYPQGTYFRVEQTEQFPNVIIIRGVAYYKDENGYRQPAVNARIKCQIRDEQWDAINRPDMAYINTFVDTDGDGYFYKMIYLKSALGGLRHFVTISTHYYDLMDVRLEASRNKNAVAEDNFYYLKLSDRQL